MKLEAVALLLNAIGLIAAAIAVVLSKGKSFPLGVDSKSRRILFWGAMMLGAGQITEFVSKLLN